MPGTIAGEIESKAANLNNLVVEAYQVCIHCTHFFSNKLLTPISIARYKLMLYHLERSDGKTSD